MLNCADETVGELYHMSAPLFIYLLFWNMQLHHHKSSISGHTYIPRHTHWSMSGQIGAEQGLSQRRQQWAGYRGLPCLQANSFWWISLKKRHTVEIRSRRCGFDGWRGRRDWGDAGNAQNAPLFVGWCMNVSTLSSSSSCDHLTDKLGRFGGGDEGLVFMLQNMQVAPLMKLKGSLKHEDTWGSTQVPIHRSYGMLWAKWAFCIYTPFSTVISPLMPPSTPSLTSPPTFPFPPCLQGDENRDWSAFPARNERASLWGLFKQPLTRLPSCSRAAFHVTNRPA